MVELADGVCEYHKYQKGNDHPHEAGLVVQPEWNPGQDDHHDAGNVHPNNGVAAFPLEIEDDLEA